MVQSSAESADQIPSGGSAEQLIGEEGREGEEGRGGYLGLNQIAPICQIDFGQKEKAASKQDCKP